MAKRAINQSWRPSSSSEVSRGTYSTALTTYANTWSIVNGSDGGIAAPLNGSMQVTSGTMHVNAAGAMFSGSMQTNLMPAIPSSSVALTITGSPTIANSFIGQSEQIVSTMHSTAETFLYRTTSTTSEVEARPDYQEVRGALTAMNESVPGGMWTVEPPVYNASIQVLETLNDLAVPQPKLISNGPKSVVFSWESDSKSLYLTVSAHSVGVLLSSKDDILVRRRLPQASVEPTRSVFVALQHTPYLVSE